ncbi:MAG: 1-deoxy-D-xylulose-5-phosphate synthase [Spirochaetaceae bacterium]|nr:1-deoxy-D-xylulose-5-phosphate synthase [Spirochaetaceae bacterium]
MPFIHGPSDLKNLDFSQLDALAAEIREVIVETVTRNGGHLASNLGVVELTIAVHRVFDSPDDKIVWDVGHQCYAHKLLTGRAERFATLRQKDGLSGFPKRSESVHDVFGVGHASTSISAALGLLAGERQRGRDARAVAVIGDGALTGGLAYEALSHAGQLELPLIVILNDNRMSIEPNVGSLSRYLSRLSMKSYYQTFRRTIDRTVKKIPRIGDWVFNGIVRLKRAVKAVFYTDNFFVDLGFEYVGPVDGHNIRRLEEVLRDVRAHERPVVVHVITRKGKGDDKAENDPSAFHGVEGVPRSHAKVSANTSPDTSADSPGNVFAGTFTQAFASAITHVARRDSRVAAITAAMEKGAGLSSFKKEFPGRFFDVGIAEEHAVTFAAGLAAAGMRPVVAVYSTFMQRAVDQVIHDVALQNLPVIFAVDRAGFVGGDGETHQGLFDVSLFRAVPNVSILCPATGAELALMLDWALAQNGPVLIRYPKAEAIYEETCPPLETGRGVYRHQGGAATPDGAGDSGGNSPADRRADICIAFSGGLLEEADGAARILQERGVPCALYNLRFLKPVDEAFLGEQLARFNVFVVAEEGYASGSFTEFVQAFAHTHSCPVKIVPLTAPAGFPPQATRAELLESAGLSARQIAATAFAAFGGIDN